MHLFYPVISEAQCRKAQGIMSERVLARNSRHAARDEVASKSQSSGSLGLLQLAIRGLWRL